MLMRNVLLPALLLTLALPAAAGQWSTGTYVYDGSGNITSVGPNSDNKTDLYRYDAFGRLKTSTAQTPTNANSQTFTYDPYGNLQLIDTVGDVSRFMPVNPATNHIDGTGTPPPGSSVVSASYDEAGNQIWLNGTYHYTYDALGRMTSLTAGSRVERYLYDADDQRIATVYGGTPQRWRYTLRDLDGHFVREYVDDITGSIHNWRWTRDYLYAEGRLYGTIVVSERTGGESRQHFHLDHLGTPRLITDDGGALLSRHTLQPFGPEAIGSTRDSEVIKFTGHERDYAGVGDTNDLDYMHARYYGPGMGRFLSIDPASGIMASPQSWNRFAYVHNSVPNHGDPTGALGPAYMYNGEMAKDATALFKAAIHYDDIREAIDNWSSHSRQEKAYAIAVVSIAILDVGSNVIAPEEGAAEHAAEAGGKAAITMDEAVARGAEHVGGEGVMETTGKSTNYQFRNTAKNAAGRTETKIARFDVNPADPHVQKQGAHLNLETQVNGKVKANEHIPIKPETVRPGDVPQRHP